MAITGDHAKERRGPGRALALGLVPLIGVLILVGCANPWARPPLVERWVAALAGDDFDYAEALLQAEDARRWRGEAERVFHERGPARAITLHDPGSLPDEVAGVVRVRLEWDDDEALCLRVRDAGTSRLALVDRGYEACPAAERAQGAE